MKRTLYIFWKDWKSFFHTPFAMVILPLYLVLCGSYFVANLEAYLTFAHPNETMQGVRGLNVMGHLLTPFFDSFFNVLVLIVPLITMRTFAEERKIGTYELLVSYPVRPWEIVVGKFLSLVLIVFLMLALSLVFPAIVAWKGHPYWPQIGAAYLGYALFLLLYVALGVWTSILTENQLIAAVVCYAVYSLSFLLGYLAHISPAPFDKFFANFLVNAHLGSFKTGLIFLGDLAVFLCGTVFFLTATYVRLRRHFRR